MSHYYKNLPAEELEELFSNFLIDSWSFSKVSTFARHEKAFEMQYIFGLYSRRGPSTIAGEGYHRALQYFFAQLKSGNLLDIVELETTAFDYIGEIKANKWKLGKTFPTIEEAVQEAHVSCAKLLRNFYGERGVYLDEIDEILDVEVYFDEFLTVNGVDIAIPCHGQIDLVVRTKNGKKVVIDHKSKKSYTDEKEAVLAIGPQAVTYAIGYEAKTGHKIDEVWFIENKPSQNKDKSAQLKAIPVPLDDNTRRLYEALLYEPLRKMILAVKDPDYVYLINQADNYVDMEEVYDFWTRTQLCEVEDFNVDEGKKHLVAKRLKKIRDASVASISPEIIRKFRENAAQFIQYDLSSKNMTHQEKIEHVLRTFGVSSQVTHTFEGFSSNTFLLEVSAGVKVSSVFKYQLDIANALDVENVRIASSLVMHNGKSYLSVEYPKDRNKDLFFNSADRVGNKLPLGQDNYGRTVIWDLDNQSTPHMLVCGATGSGKSVFIDSLIAYAKDAGVSDIVILDPKYEFRHLSCPGIDVISDVPAIEEAMRLSVLEMNRRVKVGIKSKILIIFDEYADAITRARSGNELKKYDMVPCGNFANGETKFKRECVGEDDSLGDNLAQLLQKGRSSGFRIVAAAQRASVKVIPGDAKANFPVQVCFRVQKKVDSQVVLDEDGAENLAGKGDGLLKSPEYRDTVRFQAYYKPQNQPA